MFRLLPYVWVYADVTVLNIDREEEDEYEVEHFPLQDKHFCQPHGVEVLVGDFNQDLRAEVRANPVRPLPEMYETTRYCHL